jgi:hypothetical protein
MFAFEETYRLQVSVVLRCKSEKPLFGIPQIMSKLAHLPLLVI